MTSVCVLRSSINSFLCHLAEIEIAVVDKASKLKTLLDHKKGTECLKYIVCMEEWDSSETKRATTMGVTLLSFSEIEVCPTVKSHASLQLYFPRKNCCV